MTQYGEINLEDKVAVIHGGASGMGRETAIALASIGAKVAVGDINVDGLNSLKEELGTTCVIQETNITDEEQVESLVARASEAFGSVNIGVNCAGVGSGGPLLEIPADTWRQTVDLNLTGTFLCMKHQARKMRDSGLGGVIVNLTSVTANLASIGLSPYAAARAGVNHLTRIAAEEFRDINVRVVTLAPGYIRTQQTAPIIEREDIHEEFLHNIPNDRMGETTDIAHTIAFLVSDNADFINGEVIHVDGGQRANGSVMPDTAYVRPYYRGEESFWRKS